MNTSGDFLHELRDVIGAQFVLDSLEDISQKTKEVSHSVHRPKALIYPQSVDEIQQIVRIANKHQSKISVCSRGLNWGYGGNNPIDSDTSVVVLERMNKIIEVNEKLAYAVIEPGVTYEQLNKYLKDKGHRLWADCTDGPPQGSVLGNALDRGIGETPYGDHFGNLCGMEVVLPTGELIQTGGSSPKHELKTWHTHKWGIGPSIEGLFTQSNFGIVTKSGIWLMPEPEEMNSYVFELENEQNLGAAIDTFRKLALTGVVSSKLHLISDFVTLAILTQQHKENLPKGYIKKDDLAQLRKKYGIARWSGGTALYGNKKQVAIQRKIVKREMGQYGRVLMFSDRSILLVKKVISLSEKFSLLRKVVEVISGKTLTAIKTIPYLHAVLQGIPTAYFLNHSYFKLAEDRPSENVNPARDGIGLTWFAPILPFTSEDIVPYLDESRALFEKYGFDFYMAMMMLNPRSTICLMAIMFDKTDLEEVRNATALYDELLTIMSEKKYQQYRAGIASWDRLWEKSPELKQFYSHLKQTIDPNGILAPGKYGIR